MSTHGRSQKLSTVLLLLLVATALTLLAVEGLVRLAAYRNWWGLGDPRNYAQPFCEDDYHRLRFLWRSSPGALQSGRFVQHPLFGWVPQTPPPEPPADRPWIAVLGDSFAAGVPPVPPEERIAPLLDALLPDRPVLDYAVPGWGVDQIYLRFLELAESDRPPDTVVLGVLLEDLDRVLERMRAGPKPYFQIEGDQLVLKGTPIDQTPEQWIEANPPSKRSLFLALARRRLTERSEGKSGFDSECRREEKEALSRAILEDLAAVARERRIRLMPVIFYNQRALRLGSWRAEFLQKLFAELEIETVDTRPLLLEAAATTGLPLKQFFLPAPNGHPSARANALVAQAVHRLLEADDRGSGS